MPIRLDGQAREPVEVDADVEHRLHADEPLVEPPVASSLVWAAHRPALPGSPVRAWRTIVSDTGLSLGVVEPGLELADEDGLGLGAGV